MLATYCWRQQLAKIRGERRQSSLFDTVYCNLKKYYFFITNIVFEFNTFSLTLVGGREIWLSHSD
jgi:hypothetical protein